ncbi:MAG: acyl-CoA thioesterase [Desulfobacteraceae bacterium 4572_35.2]|jgi:uncharacterized protein (TIGR00369 family)|nr:MAG: acyl-CoA thioesterase [Desulfobacteraceae bacterium 4572_35.2]
MINHSTYLGPHCVQLTQWIECAPFEKQLGIEIICAQKGQAVLTMPFREEFANGGNLLHGGALVSLADTAAVMAIKTILSPRTHFATIDMNVEFHHPVVRGIVTARSEVKQIEERLRHTSVAIEDENQRIVMTMNATFKISKRPIQPCEPR